MKEKDIISKAMKTRGYTQSQLASISGFKRQSNVSELLRGQSMRVENFVRLLNAMGYDVIVKDRNSSNKQTWTVGDDKE